MSNERSAEWLRGRKEVIFEIYDAWKCMDSAPFRHYIHEIADDALASDDIAAAEAREATQPSAAEVIEAAEKALRKLTNEIGNIEVLGEYEALDINTGSRKKMRSRIDGVEVECREAITLIARWKEANGG